MSRTARAGLAARAKMTGAAGDDHALDRRLAVAAGLAFAPINLQPHGEISPPALQVNVVAKAGALQINGAVKHPAHRPIKPSRRFGGNSSWLRERMDARAVKRLIGVNISEPGEHLLIHQPTFDGAAPPAHGAKEFVLADFARVRAERAKQRFQLFAFEHAQVSEAARIAEAQFFAAIVERHQDMSVRFKRRLAGLQSDLAGHAKPDHQELRRCHFGGQFRHNDFAFAANRGNGSAREPLGEFIRRAFNHARVANFNRRDSPAYGAFAQALGDGFNFGEFGHERRSQ